MNAEPPDKDRKIDFKNLKRFIPDPCYLRVLLSGFLTSAPAVLHDLTQALQQRNDRRARDLLHALTGSALSVGAIALAETCKRMGTEWASSSPDPASCQPLQQEFATARDALQEFLNRLPPGSLQPSPPSLSSPLTLLIVEDNDTTRTQLRLMLKSHFTLVEAANGQEALDAASGSPDLAIVDLNLGHPSADSPSGFKLLELFKDQIPTVVLTVDQRPESIQRAIKAGAWGYVVKSTDLAGLYPTIQVALARSHQFWADSQSWAINFAVGWIAANFRLDPDTARDKLTLYANQQRRQPQEVARDILATQSFLHSLGRSIAKDGEIFPA